MNIPRVLPCSSILYVLHILGVAYHCRCLFTSACNCDSVGGISGGECEGKTDPAEGLVAGRCMCKTNVQGIRCNLCKPGYWNLQSTNADGCEGRVWEVNMSHFLLASNNDVNCIQMISMANRNWFRKGMTQVAVTYSLHKAREIASLKKIWSQVKEKWREILAHLDPQNQSKREFCLQINWSSQGN